MTKITDFISAYKKKIIIGFLILIVAIVGAIWYKGSTPSATQTKYVLGTAEKGMFITSISGSGQVTNESQVDVKPKVSGNITSLNVTEGQSVKKGDLIATLDSSDASKTVRDAQQSVKNAQISLQNSQLNLEKLQQPATSLAMQQAEDAVNQAKRALDKLQNPDNSLDIKNAQEQITSAELNTQLSSDGTTPQTVRNVYDNMVGILRSSMQMLRDSLTDADGVLGIDNKTSATVSISGNLSVLDQSQKYTANNQYPLAKNAVQNAINAISPLALQGEETGNVDTAVETTKTAIDQMSLLLADVYNALLATPPSTAYSQTSIDQLKSTIQSDKSNLLSKSSSFVTQTQSIVIKSDQK